jgi:hypothetical protein
MLPATWTSSAVSSDLQPYERNLFRFADPEGASAIADLVDTAIEIEILERALYRSREINKVVPDKIHRLLARPFELQDPAHTSRFRGGYETGVLYSAESIATAALERGFHKVRFIRESVENIETTKNSQILISFDVRTDAIDIRVSPYSRRKSELADPNSYAVSQEFGQLARIAGAGAIIYSSARGNTAAPCVAILRPDALKTGQPKALNSGWSIKATKESALWVNTETSETLEFFY